MPDVFNRQRLSLYIIRYIPIIMLMALCLAGCQSINTGEKAGVDRDFRDVGFNLPATFSGKVSCVDCRGVDIVLTLRPDGLYQLRLSHRTEDGGSNIESMMNRWWYKRKEKVVVLASVDGVMQTYSVKDNDTIELLDIEHVHPESQLNRELHKVTTLEQFDDMVHMRGMFSLGNGRAVIEECSTGNVFPVSNYGLYTEAVGRYAAIPHSYGTPVLLEFEGVLGRVDYFDDQAEEAITITGFKKFYPRIDCEGNIMRVTLTETLWTLQQLNGRQLENFVAEKTPYFLLEQDSSMVGFGGCRNLTGTFRLQEDMLQINRTPVPRYACFKGLELENAFLDALRETASFEIEVDELKLIDSDDTVRAVFKAGAK